MSARMNSYWPIKVALLALCVTMVSCQKSRMTNKGVKAGDLRPTGPAATGGEDDRKKDQSNETSGGGTGTGVPIQTDKDEKRSTPPPVRNGGGGLIVDGEREGKDEPAPAPAPIAPAPAPVTDDNVIRHEETRIVHSKPGPSLSKCGDDNHCDPQPPSTKPPIVISPRPEPQPVPAPEPAPQPTPKPQPEDPCHGKPCPKVDIRILPSPGTSVQKSAPQQAPTTEPTARKKPVALSKPVAPRQAQTTPIDRAKKPESQALPPINQCYVEMSDVKVTDKLDVLFILDTSQSLDEERESIANQMDAFVSRLKSYDPNVSFRVAVMLAHGPNSEFKVPLKAPFSKPGRSTKNADRTTKGGWINRLADRSLMTADENDPPVMTNQNIHGDTGPELSVEEIKRSLKAKFNAIEAVEVYKRDSQFRDKSDTYVKGVGPESRGGWGPEQNSTAQGEAGMLTLQNAIQPGERFESLRFFRPSSHDFTKRTGHHFFRPDAALTVIFVSDENDVCFDYQKHGVKPKFVDQNEVTAFQTICDNGRLGQADDILKSLKRLKGSMPFTVNGILYTANDKIPAKSGANEGRGATPKENEAGHGYLELIEKSGGKAFNIAALDPQTGKPTNEMADYGDALAEMAHVIGHKMYRYRYPLLRPDNKQPWDRLEAVDVKTLQISFFADKDKTQLLRTLKYDGVKIKLARKLVNGTTHGSVLIEEPTLVSDIAFQIKGIEVAFAYLSNQAAALPAAQASPTPANPGARVQQASNRQRPRSLRVQPQTPASRTGDAIGNQRRLEIRPLEDTAPSATSTSKAPQKEATGPQPKTRSKQAQPSPVVSTGFAQPGVWGKSQPAPQKSRRAAKPPRGKAGARQSTVDYRIEVEKGSRGGKAPAAKKKPNKKPGNAPYRDDVNGTYGG